jgi:hypothetical protein
MSGGLSAAHCEHGNYRGGICGCYADSLTGEWRKVVQTIGSKSVTYSKAQHGIKMEKYRVVAANDTGTKA